MWFGTCRTPFRCSFECIAATIANFYPLFFLFVYLIVYCTVIVASTFSAAMNSAIRSNIRQEWFGSTVQVWANIGWWWFGYRFTMDGSRGIGDTSRVVCIVCDPCQSRWKSYEKVRGCNYPLPCCCWFLFHRISITVVRRWATPCSRWFRVVRWWYNDYHIEGRTRRWGEGWCCRGEMGRWRRPRPWSHRRRLDPTVDNSQLSISSSSVCVFIYNIFCMMIAMNEIRRDTDAAGKVLNEYE